MELILKWLVIYAASFSKKLYYHGLHIYLRYPKPHFNVMYIILDEKELQELYVTRSASFYEYQYAKSRLRSNPPKPSYAVFRQKNRQGKILKEDQFEIEFYDDKRQSLGKLAHANIDDNGTYQVMKEAEVEDGKPAALEGEYLKFRLLDPWVMS